MKHTFTEGFWWFIFLMAMLPVAMSGPCFSQGTETVNKPLRVKGDYYYPPFEFINEKGEADGFNVVLFTRIAEDLGLDYTLELGPWNEILSELENGEIDILLGLMISDERKENMLFGLPHSVMTHGIFVHKESQISSLDDLRGKAIVVQDRDRMHEYLIEHQITDKIITVPAQLDALLLLEAGKHDAALLGNFQGMHLLKKHGIKNVILHNVPIPPIDYAMAVSVGNEKLLSSLNKSLYNLKVSGEYDELYNQWFAVYDKYYLHKKYTYYMVGIALLLLLLGVFVFLLRYRVRRVTHKLRRSEEKYRLLIENQTDIVVQVDIEGRFLYVSQSYCRLFGKSEKELLGEKFMPLVHEDDRESTLAAMQKLYAPPHQVMIEQRAMTVKGWRWISWSDTAITDKDGQVKEIIGVGRDITDKKNLEQKWIESRIMLRSVLDAIPVRVFWKGRDLRYLGCNQPFAMDAGMKSPLDLLGKTDYEMGWKEQAELYRSDDTAVISSGVSRINYEEPQTTPDGRRIHLRTSKVPLKNAQNEIIGVLGTYEDITDKKRDELVHRFLFNITDAVGLNTSLEELVVIIKSQLKHLMDCEHLYVAFYDAETGLLRTLNEAVDTDEDPPRWEAEGSLTGLVIKKQKSMLIDNSKFRELEQQGTVKLIGKQSKVWLGVPLFSEGKVIGAIVVQSFDDPKAYDKSSMELMEFVSVQISHVLQKQKNLEELQEAKKKAEESDRLKTSFLNNLSHEVRTPLNGIVGCADLICSDEKVSNEMTLYSELISQNSRQLTDTINDVVTMSSLETGQIKLHITSCMPAEIIKKLQFEYQSLIPAEIDFKTHTTLPDEAIIFPADGEKVQHILRQLLNNAIKFTEAGSIELGCKMQADEMLFYVQDTGIGIDKKNQKLIFDSFRKVEDQTDKLYRGTGLGLSIVKAFVAVMDGKIELESTPGKGSYFSFSLPIPAEKNKAIKAPPQKVKTSSTENKTTHVLLVEDEKTNMIYLESVFRDTDISMLKAVNGKQAIELFKQNSNIKLVLMDLKMNVMDGFEATKQIKAISPEVPVIAVSAYALSADKHKAYQAGCDDYLTKPFRKSELIAKIGKFLELQDQINMDY